MTISRAIANNPDVLLLDEPTGGMIYFILYKFVYCHCLFVDGMKMRICIRCCCVVKNEIDLDTKNSNIIMDLLLKLNREENITCVFVTHDVSLKYFAHRVIHMLDGKISKIEIISEKRRLNAERELMEGIRNDNNMSPMKRPNENKKQIEIRDPSQFYPYLAFKQKYDLKQKMLKEKRRRKRMLRKRLNGDDCDDEEEDDDISDNEIVGDEFDDIKDNGDDDDDDIDDDDGVDMNGNEEIGLQSAESREDKLKNGDNVNGNDVVEEEEEEEQNKSDDNNGNTKQ